ncbi:MAG TPA: beta-ketoacyl synthase N-terminal-like domain-containing protein, partial [Candidatus Dormibacteraeota bacterium]|nr:beta-ketoacyl synthase N-terminal-like domain-containing protein [Candidatus Dormibacteraeota bacterium]
DAGLQPGDIQAGVVGNFASGLFTRQLHLGAFLTEADEKLRGMPTWHVEAACASGGVAVLTAAQLISGGIHDVMLVAGAEQQKTMDPAAGADVLGAAADYEIEKPFYGDFMFPKLFARIAEIYGKRYGLTEEQLARVAVKNHAHARLNPQAQKRDSALTLAVAATSSKSNPSVAPPLKVSDCSQITDGGAALILCSARFMNKLSRRPVSRLLGWGHTTDYLALEKKDAPDFSVARQAARQAYTMAGLQPHDIQVAEVHDCFSISEILAYELLGFADSGQGAHLLESGLTALPAVQAALGNASPPSRGGQTRIPVNVGGGLMGDGHPVGATGVRQVVEAHRHLTGMAGQRQVEGVQRFLTFNMGGSVTTSVVMIWAKEA